MRGKAFRRTQARNKYTKRAKQIYDTYGGFKVINGKVVRCESIKDFLDSTNPYTLKNQGNFEHRGKINLSVQSKKVKDKVRAKNQIQYDLNETDQISGIQKS